MRDPYLYEDVPVLKNLLGIKDAQELETAEANITYLRFYTLDGAVQGLAFDFSRLLAIHKHIFGDLYEWAGTVRTIPMVKASDGPYSEYEYLVKIFEDAIRRG